jgi:hypothetical protein
MPNIRRPYYKLSVNTGENRINLGASIDYILLGLPIKLSEDFRPDLNLLTNCMLRFPCTVTHYIRQQGRAHPTHGLPLKTRQAQSGCGHAGCRSSGSSPDTDSGAL